MNIWYRQLNAYSIKLLALLLFIILWNNGYTFFACTLFYVAVIVGSYVLGNTSLRKNSFGPKEAVIITGCDSGLGYGLALHCHSLGAVVFAGVHNEHSRGAEKLKELKVPVFPLELTSQSSIDIFCEIISRMIKEHGLHLKALVNNAGVMVLGEFEWQTKTQIVDQINVNLVGTINFTQKFLPLVRSHKARIVIVSSHCSFESLPGFSIYGVTKAGLIALATSLRVELKKLDVSVVSFVPGSFVMESNIMSSQKKHFQEQRQNMSDEARKVYGEYFDRYEQYFSPISRTNDAAKLSNEKVFKTFEGCIFDEYPKAIYKCEPWRYKWYYTLCKITPTWLRDILVLKLVCTPEWEI